MARHLGKTITAEIAAAIEVEAFARQPLPTPCTQRLGALRTDGEQREEYLAFLNAAFGTNHRMDRVRVLGILRGEAIAAVIMYSRMSPRSCEMTIATDGARDWATRSVLRAAFNYAFSLLALHRVTVVIHECNAASIDLCERLGFKREGVVRESFEDANGVVMGMLRRECRWIGDIQ